MCFHGNSLPHKKKTEQKDTESRSDFALLVAGEAPSLAVFYSIRGKGSGTDFKIELKSFVWRPSEQIDFSPTAPQRQSGESHTSLPCGTGNFSKLENIEFLCCT